MPSEDTFNLLVVESTSNDVEQLLNSLRGDGFHIESSHVHAMDDFDGLIGDRHWDMVLFATDVASVSLEQVVEAISRRRLDLPVIALHDGARPSNGSVAVRALECGARDAVEKSNIRHLGLVLKREYDNLVSRRLAHHWRDALDEREQRWRQLLDASRDPIAYVHGGMHIHANPTYLDMFGYDSIDELEGLPVLDLIVAEDQARFKEFMRENTKDATERSQIEVAGLRSDGNRIDILMELSHATFEGEECWQIVIRDQSESNEIRAQLEYLKKHDPLTGLYNRQYFMANLQRAISRTSSADSGRMLVYLELDNFNVVKETIGIGATDTLIADIGRVLLGQVPEGSLLARFGDSVFTLMIQVPHIRAAWDIADELRLAVGERIIDIAGKSVTTTCSIGICPMLSRARAPETVLAEAQHSCRTARMRGGNRIEIHFPAGAKTGVTKVTREPPAKTVEVAIKNEQLSLLFQPIVNLHEESMEMYEVFLRVAGENGMPLPESSIFSPEVDAEIVTHLDEWVIEQVVQLMAERQRAGHKTHFFVKLSEQAIVNEHMVLYIGKQLRAAQVSGQYLILKVSETSAMSQVKNVKAFIKGLRQLECSTALEDFGTGLTSFNTLRHVAVDYLKIDAALVHTLATDIESKSAVRSIVDMARTLKKRVVAVGVEDAATLALLWDMGVHFAQGDGIQTPGDVLEWDFASSEIN